MPVLHITFPKLPRDLALSPNHSKPGLGNSTRPLSQSASDQSSYYLTSPFNYKLSEGLGLTHLKLILETSKSLKEPFRDLEVLRVGLLPPSPSFSTTMLYTGREISKNLCLQESRPHKDAAELTWTK